MLKNAYLVASSEGQAPISSFVARKVQPLANKLGAKKLGDALALCTDTQFGMRNTGMDAGLLMDTLVIKLAYSRNAASRKH